jgi:hypothetical protein
MEREFVFGVPEGVNETVLHPLGLVAVLVFGIAILLLPRRYAVLPLLLTACLIAPAQRIAIFRLDFTLLRIVLSFGALRLLDRRSWASFRWKALDTAVLIWISSGALLNIAQYWTMAAVTNRLGWAYEGLITYFVVRTLVRDWEDLNRISWAFVVVSIPVAIAFVFESYTGRNPFAFFGGVPEVTIIREGRLRCQGAFAHPILAGCFWAVLMPFIAALWWQGTRGRAGAVVGLIASCTIILACASSTPLSAVACGILGASAFFLRDHLRLLRWGLAVTLIGLHMVMNNPVWHLFAKVDLVGGSTGWARYYVIDLAVKHFDDWFLIGTSHTEHWTGGDYLDVVNQYVLEGLNGGFLTLTLFVVIIVLGFQGVGRLWRTVAGCPSRIAMSWALGVSLFMHMMNFFGVSYFGQIVMLWYTSVAMIAAMVPLPQRRVNKQQRTALTRRRTADAAVGPVATRGEVDT